jgi:c-di-GMP phosphodiesterase
MKAQAASAKPSGSTSAGAEAETCLVARQPILNVSGRLYGYELLFRAAKSAADAQPSVDALLDNTLLFGLERFTNGFPAFLPCSVEMLAGDLIQVLPPSMTVLAVPASAALPEQLIAACQQLKARGFRIALDDYSFGAHPLLGIADFIRTDFTRADRARPSQVRVLLESEAAELIARNVETEDDYRLACQEGFTLFQGGYLFRPALVRSHKVPVNRLFHFEILQQMYREPVDIVKLGEVVMRDASLTFRLLRLVNSPACAVRQEIRSVESAIIIVGLDTFRRFATIAILGESGGAENPELLNLALVRARFCELAARVSREDPSEQYLLGLFSLLPAMLRLPMEELTPTLPLRDEVRQALEGAPGRARCLLTWLECHERGDWAACDELVESHRLSNGRLSRCYNDAIAWAQTAVTAVTA